MIKRTTRMKKAIAAVFMSSVMAAGAVTPCSVFTQFTIPAETVVAEAADSTYGDYNYRVESDNTVTLTKYNGSAKEINNIPTKIGGRTVTRLKGTFSGNNRITKVTIPSSITEIGDEAFYCTGSLQTITFASPDNLKKLGNSVFFNSGISNLSLGKNVTSIGTWTFEKCKNLKSFTWPTKVTTVETGVLSSTGLTTITIPSNVTVIKASAFSGCESLQTAYIQGDCTINRYAFAYCNNLNFVSISKNCTLAEKAFCDCKELANISLTKPTLASGFQNRAFFNCEKLKKINGSVVTQKYSSGKPYFISNYNSTIRSNWAEIDYCRVGFYNDYLDAEVAYVVQKETTGCTTPIQKIKKLQDWVVNKVDYAYVGEGENQKPDPSLECHVDSSVFMQNKTVCDGYARALVLLLRKANIEAHYVTGFSGTEWHAWVIVKLGNYYFHMDPTAVDKVDTELQKSWYNLRSDAEFKEELYYSDWGVCVPISNSRISLKSSTTPKCLYSLGDVNKDGMTNRADKQAVLNHIAKIKTIPSSDLVLADMSMDGTVTVSDAVKINAIYGMMGDAFTNGIVDQTDVEVIKMQVETGNRLTYRQKARADVNYDGKVTIDDANIIARAIRNGETDLL